MPDFTPQGLSAKDLAVTRSLFHWWLAPAVWVALAVPLRLWVFSETHATHFPLPLRLGQTLLVCLLGWLAAVVLSVPYAVLMTLLQRPLYRYALHWAPWQRWAWLLGSITVVHVAALFLLAYFIVDEPLPLAEPIRAIRRHPQLFVALLGWWLASLGAAAWLNRRELRQPVRVP